jgi:hypothetical protein
MAYGLRVINDASEILVDSNYINPTFIKKVEFNATATSTAAGSPLLHSGYVARSYTTPGLGITGNWIVLWAIPSNTQDVWYKLPQQPLYGSSNVTTLSCTVYANSSGQALSYSLPTAYIFGVDSLTIGALPSTGPALRLYSDTGQKTFDSNHLQLLPYSISNEVEIPAPDNILAPNQPESIKSLLIDVPGTNPIFLLPHAQYFQASDDIYFSGFSPGIPGTDFSATSVVFKREPSTQSGKALIKLKSLFTYYKNITPRNEYDSAFLTSGNTVQLSVLCADGNFYATAGAGTGGGANPQYELSANYSSVNEGTIVTVTLNTTLVSDNTLVPYTITGISGEDLVSGGLTGSFNVVSNTANAQFIIKNDSVTEGPETFTLTLNGLAVNTSFTILDTSIAAAQYSFGTVPSVNEGGNYIIPFSATNAGGQEVSFTTITATTGTYWNQGVRLDGALLTSSFVVPGNSTATTNVSFTTYKDLMTDGQKTFRIQASVNGTVVATSANIFITDTSTSSITAPDTILELTPSTEITISVANGYDLGELSNIRIESNSNKLFVIPGQPNNWTINSNSFSATTYLYAASVTEDTPVTLSLIGGGGNITPLAEKTITVINATPSYSWEIPSAINEGSTGSLQFNYSNAANTTIYFAISPGANVTSSDVTLNTTSHTVGNSNAAGSVSVSYSVSADAFTEGVESFTLSGAGVFSQPITINDTSTTPEPAYSITANSTPWNESSTRVCSVSVQNAAGTTLALVSDNASVTSQVATIYINSNNYSTLTYWNVGDVAADVTVNMALKINGTGTAGGYNGTLVATTSALVRNIIPAGTVLRYFCSGVDRYVVKADGTYNGEYTELYEANSLICGYIPPSWALSASPTNINEGGSTTITLTTNQSGNFAYTISGVSSADIGGTSLTGVLANGGSRVITLTADNLTEPTETLTLALNNGQASASVTINDTSRSSVEILQSGNINGTVGTSFSSTFTVEVNGSQYPAIWSYSGTLPPGLNLTASSNTFSSYYMVYVLSGTPTTAGTYNFTITATASTSPADTVSVPFSVTIYEAFGVYYSQYCSGVDLYYRYHNGSGGFFDSLYQANSPSCGYIAPTYSLSASPTNVNEGSSTTITLTTNQSGNFGYTITGVTSADIGGTSLTGTLANGGTRVINVTNDSLTEGTETLTVSLDNGQASTAVTINDTSRNVLSINQSGSSSGTVGSSFSTTFTVTVNGSQYPAVWSYSGSIPPGTSWSQYPEVFSGFYLVYGLSGTPTVAGTYTFTVNATASTGDSVSASFTVTIAPAPTYSLTRSVASVNEGGSFTISFSTNQSGNFGYTISGVSSADISNASLTGTITNGSVLTYTAAADLTTEGAETFNIALNNGQASTSVTINDTSTTPPTYALTRSAASVNEGTIITITLTTTSVSDGTSIPYTITGISTADLVSGGLTGNFSISSNSANAQFIIKNDSLTEGTETFTLALDNGQASISVTINDTSITPTYSLTRSVASVNEGGSFTITFSTNQSGSFGYTITGVSSNDISLASLTGTVTNGTVLTYTVAADAITEGAEIFGIDLDNGQAGTSVTINDTSTSTLGIERGGDSFGTVGTSFSSFFRFMVNSTQTGAAWSYTGTLPPGLTLTETAGYSGAYQIYSLAGTPTTTGVYTFTITATAGLNSTSQQFSINISNPSPNYYLANTWTSLANGSSSTFTVTSNYANGVTLTPSISGTGSARVSIDPTSRTISGNGTVNNNFTVTATTPTATIAEQSVTISVAGTSFTFTVPAYTFVPTAPIVTSVTMSDITYPPGLGVQGSINFSGPITANTYVNVRFVYAGNTTYLPNNSSTQGASPPGAYGYYGEDLTLTIGQTSATFLLPAANTESDQFNNRVSAKTVTAPTGGSDRQAYVEGGAFTLLGSGGGGNQNQ